ncbi:hypothetical protein K474DRAFT_1733498 [Panus rudis PR-1116 ss-1]|nr:hypothetical protein K474DRAFT_1733498 [Panus rudis PR-1116 ss-1]
MSPSASRSAENRKQSHPEPPPIIKDMPVPDHISEPVAAIAINKLLDYKWVELYYFTHVGCEEAAEFKKAQPDNAMNLVNRGHRVTLEPTENVRALSHVTRNEHLSWSQLEDVAITFGDKIERIGWPEKYVTMFKVFFGDIMAHPAQNRPHGKEALILYQA